MPEERTRRERGKVATRLNRYGDVRAGNVTIGLKAPKAEPVKTDRTLSLSEKKKGRRSKKGQAHTVGILIFISNTLDERLERAVDIESDTEVTFGLGMLPRTRRRAKTRLDTFRCGYPTHILETGRRSRLGVRLSSEVRDAESSTHGPRTVRVIRCPLSIVAKSQGEDAM